MICVIYSIKSDNYGIEMSCRQFEDMSIKGIVERVSCLESRHSATYVFFTTNGSKNIYMRSVSSVNYSLIAPGDSVVKEKKCKYMVIKSKHGDLVVY